MNIYSNVRVKIYSKSDPLSTYTWNMCNMSIAEWTVPVVLWQ